MKSKKSNIDKKSNAKPYFFQLLVNKYWSKAVILIVLFNLLLSSWFVLHGDLKFHTDIGRDFLLLEDLSIKKFVLIGPHAGPAGFFHGPLWMYLNLPVYLLGNGNPIVVGWFWVLLTILFYLSSFQIAKKLFNKNAAYIYLLLISVTLINTTREYSHQHMGMFLMPLFFYTFLKYINTLQSRFLMIHVILGGLLIQFEIAYGGPLCFVSFIYLLYVQVRKRKLLHFLSFFLILIPLSSYILFDLRHDFFMFKSMLIYLKGNSGENYVGFASIIKNRLEYMVSSAIPLLWNIPSQTKILGIMFLGLLIRMTFENTINSKIYRYFFYFFFGFFIFSLSNRYYLLGQHFLGFVPIVFMMVASLINTRFAKYVVLLFLFIILNNEVEAVKFIVYSNSLIGKDETSWKFHDTLSQKAFSFGPENEFGYFVYTPDKFAYVPRFAMIYGQRTHPEKKAFEYTKKPVTYIVMAPPPKDQPYISGEWWRIHSIKIDKIPTNVVTFPNGYQIQRYELTPQETAIPFDETQDMGIHFR